ncbi:MAG: ABC transporter substrate-binding protein [Pseudobdellovibrionaceae bacterium]|nr:ABC transporter substrate-binding protein [Pseudobdellovibrionaceae bacterium]
MRFKKYLRALFVLAGVCLPFAASAKEETIKVGILHSLSGTMAISEGAGG